VYGGTEGDVSGLGAIGIECAKYRLVVVVAQVDSPGLEQFFLFRDDALQEVHVIAESFIWTRLELHQLHDEATGAKFVVEIGFAAALGDEVNSVNATTEASLDFGDEHRLTLCGKLVAVALL
jgi:hypothetical protein